MIITETCITKQQKSTQVRLAVFIVNKGKTQKKILDLTTTEWLQKEFQSYTTFVIDCYPNMQLKDSITPYLQNFDYFVIIYNDTPYLTNNIIDKIFEYVVIKNSKACKLYSGAVYNTSYYLSNNDIMFDSFYLQNEDCFRVINDEKDLIVAEKYFTKKIINDLKKKNVFIDNPESVVISANCEIGEGTTILNNCAIKGKSKIGKNVVINNNTTIIDSVIGDSTSVSNSTITKSKIGTNTIISPYCNITKSNIDNDCVIGYYCVVDGWKLKKGTNITERTSLIKTKGENK